jgi:hypothetical protein
VGTVGLIALLVLRPAAVADYNSNFMFNRVQ